MSLKLLGAVLVATSGLMSANANASMDSRYYEIKKVVVNEVVDTEQMKVMAEQVGNFTQGCTAENTPNAIRTYAADGSVNPLDAMDVIVDKIINIGKKIWTIVDAGKPVVNVKVDAANALPTGIYCWDQLESWQAPISKLYKVSYENGFGSEVVTYNYRVSFISGGSYKGQGQYITLATVQPANIDVSWGFRFDAAASVPMVFNQGTKAAPIAGMQLAMNWKVTSPLQEIQQAEGFFINGQGTLQKLK